MINYDPPATWVVSNWHPDLGDAEMEMSHLRSLAKLILERLQQQLSVGLAIPEPGLMHLVVDRKGKAFAEVYSIPPDIQCDQRKYGLFLFPSSVNEEVTL